VGSDEITFIGIAIVCIAPQVVYLQT